MDPLVTHFLLARQADGVTEATIRWHRDSLRQFTIWRTTHDVSADPSAWTTPVLRQYIVYCQTRVSERTGTTLAGSAVNSLIRSLKAFCRWLLSEELVDRDLFHRVSVPKSPDLVQRPLSRDEIVLLMTTIRSGGRNARRDEALFALMLDTGARASEVCHLHLEHVDWEWGLVRHYGKGRKERLVPVSPRTTSVLQRYLLRDRGHAHGPLFQSEEGHGLTRWGLNQIYGRLCKRAGVHIAPHKIRHTFAIEYLRAGGSVFALQKLLCHTSLTMTLGYARLVTDDLVVAHQQFSPVTRILSAGRRSRCGSR